MILCTQELTLNDRDDASFALRDGDYFGRTIGRVCNRIKGGAFSVGGKVPL